jgi:hypothetical protein
LRRLLLAIPLILTWGCFSPSYDGPGGFTCKTSNACPEGFECVGGLCVKEGTTRDGSVDGPADGPVADRPAADGPATDGPVADLPTKDGPAPDGPTPDTVKSDTVKPDGPAPDTLKPDTLKPDTLKPDTLKPDAPVPDGPVPDGPLPDTLKPDTLKPDAGPQSDAWPAPWCNISMAAIQTVSTAANIHDIVVDSHGRAHLIFVDSAGLIYHLWNQPTGSGGGAWTFKQLAKTYTGDRIAAAIDSNDVIHVAFRNPADNHRPYYLYGAYSPAIATTWSSPKKIISADQLGDSLDVAANGTNVFIAASRNTFSTSDFHLWKVNRSTNPYGLDKFWVQNLTSQTYEYGRLAAGSNHVATTFFDGTNYQLQATPVGGGAFVAKMVTGSSSGPAPVAAAGSNQILMAHVNTMGGLLQYEQWDGKSASSVTHDSLTGSAADPYNLDIKGGGPGVAVLVYRKSSGSTPWPYLVTRTSSGWVTSPPKLVTAGKTDDLHMTINPSLKHAWIVFSVAGKLSVRCINY